MLLDLLVMLQQKMLYTCCKCTSSVHQMFCLCSSFVQSVILIFDTDTRSTLLLLFVFFLLYCCSRHGMGLSTGIDLNKLVTTGNWICNKLQSRRNGSKVALAMLG